MSRTRQRPLAESIANSERRDEATRRRKRAEAVNCEQCSAIPFESCTTESGRSCKPHAVREARSNGLHPTPRAGHFTHGKAPVEFEYRELLALARRTDDEEFAKITRGKPEDRKLYG